MNKKLIFINERVSVEDTRFLLTINKEAEELYILHREYPRCLVYVEQSTPINFIILDLFENNSETEKAIAILTSQEFKKDLKEFFVSQSFNQEDFN